MSDSDYGGDDNNHPIPVWVHVPMTFVSLVIFLLSMQQLCGASMDSVIIKYRAGVACSCFTFLIVSISLNFELAEDAGDIDLSENFVLIVRTLMVLWTFIAFVIAYWFVVHAVRAAYKSTHGINKVEAPAWIQKFWFIVICVEEIILFLCYVFAFATMDVLPWKIFILSTFVVAVIGASIAFGSLLDVQWGIRNAVHRPKTDPSIQSAQLNRDESHIRRLKHGQRILRAITVFAIGVIIGSILNIYLLVDNLVNGPATGEGSLTSRVIDNVVDYLSFMLILDFINLALLFWTYKSNAINYCCFCCDYSRYATESYRDVDIDPSVLCFLCCGGLIETADDKRQKLIDDLPPPTPSHNNENDKNNNNDNNNGATNNIEIQQINDVNSNNEDGMEIGRLKSGTRQSETDVQNPRKGTGPPSQIYQRPPSRQASQVESRIRVVIYNFDGVLTCEHYRVFEHRTIQSIGSMPFDTISFHFGGAERIISLKDHFKTLFDQGVKMYVVSQEETGKLYAILKKLDLVRYFMKIQHSSRLIENENVMNDVNNENGDNGENDEKKAKEDMHYFERTLKDEDHNRALMYGIIGCDNPVMQQVKGNLGGFILELIKLKSKQTLINDEILFVSTDVNLVHHFRSINLCRSLKIESIGLSDNDYAQIEKRA